MQLCTSPNFCCNMHTKQFRLKNIIVYIYSKTFVWSQPELECGFRSHVFTAFMLRDKQALNFSAVILYHHDHHGHHGHHGHHDHHDHCHHRIHRVYCVYIQRIIPQYITTTTATTATTTTTTTTTTATTVYTVYTACIYNV